MRVICSSATAATVLASGALTQLEWIEAVATRTPADGVALAAVHFPRDDAEYFAHVRKIAVDLSLEVLVLEAPDLLDPATPAAERDRLIAMAAGTGAAIVRTRLGPPGAVPPEAFAQGVVAAKAAARAAKAANVTLAVEPAEGTIGADLAEVRHLVKDVDSAWLRYALAAFSDDVPGQRDRVVLRTAGLDDDAARAGARLSASRSPLVLGGVAAGDPFVAVAQWVERLRQSTAAAVLITK